MAGKNMFNSVKMAKPPKSRFDMSHDVKTTMNMGELIPVCLMPCMPGDKWGINCESLVRFMPMLAPIYHRVDVTIHYFFVPHRIVWSHFQQYITNGGDDPLDTPPAALPAFPIILVGDGTGGSAPLTKLAHRLGLPAFFTGGVHDTPINVSAVPFACYQMIYDQYYRDQNLIDSLINQLSGDQYLIDGDNTSQAPELMALKNRAWEHDYFTSCLPFAQKGEVVQIPLGSQEVVVDPALVLGTEGLVRDASDASLLPGEVTLGTGAAGEFRGMTSVTDAFYDPNGTLVTAASGEATNLNDFRVAMRTQEWLEKNARGGTRYVENILVHFGVRSSDKRLQRPEYITGVKSSVKISEVLQTSSTDEETPQGNMAGHGVGVVSGKYGSYFCEEHGYIMAIMSAMPKTGYFQGIERHWLMVNDPTEFPWPSFANLGEQAVLNAEVFAYKSEQMDTFGYNPRYSEWKYVSNRSNGDFITTLLFWTLDREFNDTPPLDAAFVSSDPSDRIFAVQDASDHILAYIHHNISVVRALPKYGIPTF